MREKVSAPITSARLVRAGLEEIIRRGDGIDETGADRLQIEGGAVMHAEPGLDLRRGGGEGVVRCRCGTDDEVDIIDTKPRIGERGLRGLDPEHRGGLVFRRDMALADAGALGDPGIGGFDDGFGARHCSPPCAGSAEPQPTTTERVQVTVSHPQDEVAIGVSSSMSRIVRINW